MNFSAQSQNPCLLAVLAVASALAYAGETPAVRGPGAGGAGFLARVVETSETPALRDETFPLDTNMRAVPSKSYLPQPAMKTPRLAETSRQQPLRLRPSGDLPALVRASGELGSRPALTPASAPACAEPPDASRLARPWCETSPDPARANLTADPAQDQMLAKTMAAGPELKQKPAPYLRLAIPDPLPACAVIRLRKDPPDNDAPVALTERSLRPVLPTPPLTASKP
jgi:hypothetical protein